jgi:cytochrome c
MSKFIRGTVSLLLTLASSSVLANRELATKYDCFSCHAVEYKLIGPAYRDVAAKYGTSPESIASLAARIRSGGTGKWGTYAMPSQNKVTEAEAFELAKLIMNCAK